MSTFTKTGNTGIITLEGELTLPHAEELRSILIKALIDTNDVSIAMKNVEDVDLSCLQLLCSANRSAARLKKQIAFTGSPPELFSELVEASGFARITGCKLDCGKSCLWAAGASYE